METSPFATWKRASRGRLQLWEGTGGFGARLIATADRRRDGRWAARFGLEAGETFRTEAEAVLATSRRAAGELGREVRTATRVVVPGGDRAAH